MKSNKNIKVLVVDDSRLFSRFLKRKLDEDKNIEIVGIARDPYEARDKILKLKPDVLTLDVEMPKMDGIEFLKRLLPQYYIPVVMVSAVNEKVFEALEAGAVEFVEKPQGRKPSDLDKFIKELSSHIKAGAVSKNKTVRQIKRKRRKEKERVVDKSEIDTKKFVLIGASTGGTNALKDIITKLPGYFPPVIIVQHMPPVFTQLYAKRVNKISKLNVIEAQNGQIIESNNVYIAPGGYQMEIRKSKSKKGYYFSIKDGENVNGHKPSVDVMFHSASQCIEEDMVGVILTGMGKDGAKGLLNLRKIGARTIGQDKESCVVYGMPKVAYEIGAVEFQKTLTDIPKTIIELLRS